MIADAKIIQAPPLTETLDIVREIMAQVLRIDVAMIDLDTSLIDLGVDSLALIDARLLLEERLGLKLGLRMLAEDLTTVGKLVAYLHEQRIEHAPSTVSVVAHAPSREVAAEAVPAPPPAQPSTIAVPPLQEDRTQGAIQSVLLRQLQLIEQQVRLIQGVTATAMPVAMTARPAAHGSATAAQDAWDPPWAAPMPRTMELYIAKIGATVEASLPKSVAWARAPKRLVRKNASTVNMAGLPFSLSLQRIDKGKRQDLDGNRYLDLSPTVCFSGCAKAPVEQAEQLAKVICARAGKESICFFASGSQALEQAIEAARKATGRSGIVQLRYTSLDDADNHIAAGYRPAALLADANLSSPKDLAEASRAAESCGALLIVDRSVSTDANSMHEDLTVFGESLSNGCAFGALVGTRDLLEEIPADGADVCSTVCDAVLQSFSGEADDGNDALQRLQTLLREEGVPLRAWGEAGAFCLRGAAIRNPDNEALIDVLRLVLLSKRVYVPKDVARARLDPEEEAVFFNALRASAADLRHAGLLRPRTGIVAAVQPATKVLPVSPAQREYWAASTLAGGASSANHVTTAVHFRGTLDVPALTATLNSVANRHESLRAHFSEDGTTQTIEASVEVEFCVFDATEQESAQPVAWIELQAKRPFALDKAPLLRASILRIAEDDYYLVLVMHHLVADGWSVQVVMGELVEWYGATTRGQSLEMGKPHQLTDYLAWLEKQKVTAAQTQAFWLRQIADPIEPLGLQKGRRAPGSSTSRGGSYLLVLDAVMRQKLLDLSRHVGGSFFSTLLAGLSATLARFSGKENIAIGIASAGQSVSAMPSLVGYCLSQLLLRFSLPETTTVRQHLQETRSRVLEAQEHRNYSARDVAREAKLTSNTLADLEVAFNLNRHLAQGRQGGELRAELVKVPVRAVPFPLNVMAVDDGQNVRIDFQYATDLFEPGMVSRIAEGFRRVLENFTAEPEAAVWDLKCFDLADLPSRDRWCGEELAWPGPKTAIGLFEEQVSQHGAAIALQFGAESISYSDLQARVNAFAQTLLARGVGPDKLVGVYQSRGTLMVVSLLAVWKAGGAYVALDPHWPAARINSILQQTEPVVVLTDQGWTEGLDERWNDVFFQAAETPTIDDGDTPSTQVCLPGNLAYVLYTSGSTGTPKGAMITHGSLLNYIQYARESYGQHRGSWGTSLVSSPLVFDLTVTSLIVPLCAGGCVRLLEEEGEIERLEAELLTGDYSLLKLTPSHLRALMAFGALRLVRKDSVWVVGGEALNWELVRALAGARLINEYGPTETTVGSSVYTAIWQPECTGDVPIGRPIANTQLYVLDHTLRPLPVEVEGELYIAGAGLARGYWGRPDWTASRFLPDPYGEPGARMYHTGDRVRWRADGQLEYLGRADDQVKLRGYRIELGEIAMQLMRHPNVAEAIVVTRSEDNVDQHLVAYYTLSAAAQVIQASDGMVFEELRSHLSRTLPQYMLPSAFVRLEALPLTRNGKVDRKALPVPENLLQQVQYSAPRTPLEAKLCEIWSTVLGVERVGLDDDFFGLGGDSIVLIEMIARARAAQIDLRTGHLTGGANVRAISELLGPNVTLVQDQIAPEGPAKLTPAQHWFFELPLTQRNHWNQAVLLELRVAQSESIVRRALEKVVEQHDALRWRFRNTVDGWCAFSDENSAETSYERVDLSQATPESYSARITDLSTAVQAGLDIERGLVFRAVEFVMPPGESNRLLLVAHHLVIDGVSWRAILTHLYLALRQASSGAKTIDLGPRTTAAAVWAERLEQYAADSNELRAQLPFWLAQTATQAERIPRDFAAETATAATERTVETELTPDETTLLLRQLPEVYRTQINEVLVTALCLAISHWTGSESLLLQLEGHGREPLFDDVDLSRTAGWFTSLFPVRVHTRSHETPVQTLLGVQKQLQQVPMHGLGYGLLRYCGPDASIRSALAEQQQPEVCLNYLGQFDQLRASQEMLVRAAESPGPIRCPQDPRTHVLLVEAMVLDGCMRTSFTYSSEMHREQTIAALAAEYSRWLKVLIEDQSMTAPTYAATDFPLAELSDQEMQEVLRQMAL